MDSYSRLPPRPLPLARRRCVLSHLSLLILHYIIRFLVHFPPPFLICGLRSRDLFLARNTIGSTMTFSCPPSSPPSPSSFSSCRYHDDERYAPFKWFPTSPEFMAENFALQHRNLSFFFSFSTTTSPSSCSFSWLNPHYLLLLTFLLLS